MGGGNIPGPESGHEVSPDSGVTSGFGADLPGPIATGQGTQQQLNLTGWPRDIEWSEFREVTERPAGESEAAQINPVNEATQARTARVDGQWMLATLNLQINVNRDESWVVVAQKSAALKAHEQGHFDIHCIIAGRDLIETLRGLRARTNERLGRAVTRAMQRSQQQAQQLTNEYDRDTAHGAKNDRQAIWEAQIRRAISNNSGLRAPN